MKVRIGKLHHNSVPVNKLDVNKNIIETFDTVTEAQNKTGAGTIAKAIKTNGKRKGFYWEYANKDIVQSSQKYEKITQVKSKSNNNLEVG